jgi:CBS domain-containing protein
MEEDRKMKVKDVMMRTPVSCRPETNVGAAVEMMWVRNCGMLPVVNEDEKVIGVVTDRDICIALGTRNRLPGEITIAEVSPGKSFCCKGDDDVHAALGAMAKAKVRRLPVINDQGKLEGILSMDDVVRHAEAGTRGRTSELSYDDTMETLKRVYQPQFPVSVKEKAAAA